MPRSVTSTLSLIFAAASIAIGTAAPAHSAHESLADVARFFEMADVVGGPKIVDCTLSGGTKTTCFSIMVRAVPQTYF